MTPAPPLPAPGPPFPATGPPTDSLQYALFEELEAEEPEHAREVYRACLKLIPHRSFTFAKVGGGGGLGWVGGWVPGLVRGLVALAPAEVLPGALPGGPGGGDRCLRLLLDSAPFVLAHLDYRGCC